MARNTLTQRTSGPRSTFEVTVDCAQLQSGDRAGLCALQGSYAAILVCKDAEGFRLTLEERNLGEGRKYAVSEQSIAMEGPSVRLRAAFDYDNLKDVVTFFYEKGGQWVQLGGEHKLRYTLDHFMGCRIGLCCYNMTQDSCGKATFCDFTYDPMDD